MGNFLQSASDLARSAFNNLTHTVGNDWQALQQKVQQVLPSQAPIHTTPAASFQQIQQAASNIGKTFTTAISQPAPFHSKPIGGLLSQNIASIPTQPAIPQLGKFSPTNEQIFNKVVAPLWQVPLRTAAQLKQTPIVQNLLPGQNLPSNPITPTGAGKLAFGSEPLVNYQQRYNQGFQIPFTNTTVKGIASIPLFAGGIALDLSGLSGADRTAAQQAVSLAKRATSTEDFTKVLATAKPEVQNVVSDMINDTKSPVNSTTDFFHAANPTGKAMESLKNLMRYPADLKARGYSANQISRISATEAKNIAQNNILPFDHPTFDASKTPTGSVSKDTASYLSDLSKQQKETNPGIVQGIVNKGFGVYNTIRKAFVDNTSPIEDALSSAEKQNKFSVLPSQDIRYQIDRVLRAKSLASQFAQDNGLTKVIQSLPTGQALHTLDQYMIAKHAATVAGNGIQTGRDLVKDKQLVTELAPTLDPLAQQVNQYSRKLLAYSVQTGLVSKDLATQLLQKYPDYVPLNRVIPDNPNSFKGTTKAVASLAKQTVVQKLKGSTLEIQSPIQSLLQKTQVAIAQGEKNVAAKMLASYRDLPGFQGLIEPATEAQGEAHTFSYLDDGVKKLFRTTPEIASAAHNMTVQQINVLGKILNPSTRLLQLGSTGLNTPFAATNLLKDQWTTLINSNPKYTASIMNPVNFMHSLFAAVSHNDLYKEVVRSGGMSTHFDITRDAKGQTVKEIQAGRSVGSNILYTARNPKQLLSAVEDIIGRTEQLTRIQNYRGTQQVLLKQGRTAQDASILAADQARRNTANFARNGDFGKVISQAIPFFNANIQGSRSLVYSARKYPVQTGAKLALSLFLPVAVATLWNTTDPQRRAVYQDINDYEKQNNLIIVPPGSTKDANGKYNVIKIPISPEFANLASIVRQGMEKAQGIDGLSAGNVLANLIGSATGQNIDTSKSLQSNLASNYIPQVFKPIVETQTNQNLFTGLPIVPQSMQNLPPDQQVKPNTSGTARLLSKVPVVNNVLSNSPLKTENAIRTASGGVGSQALNAADTVLAATGVIPKDQVGGETIPANIERRFTQATGGANANAQFTDIKNSQQQSLGNTNELKQQAATLYDQWKQLPRNQASAKFQALLQSNPKLAQEVSTYGQDIQLGLTPVDRSIKTLSVTDGTRARYLVSQFDKLPTTEEKSKLWTDYVNKKIITAQVAQQVSYLLKQSSLQQSTVSPSQ